MHRTQIYLTEIERQQLNRLSKVTGRHKSALIRDAIDQFIGIEDLSLKKKQAKPHPAAGLWAKREDLPNYNELKNEFDRKAIDSALEREKNILKDAFREAENDPDLKDTMADWAAL